MPDAKDGGTALEAELKALLDAYGDTFIARPAGAAAFYSEPCMTARSGEVRVHPTHADLAVSFTEADNQYRKLGYTHFDDVSFDWRGLGANSALVTMRWAYKDGEEQTIWETKFSYNLYKQNGAWKILMQTMHDQ